MKKISDIPGLFIGWFAGWTIGSSLGVYVAADSDDETGSFHATFLGSAVGAGIETLLFMYAIDSPLLVGSFFLPSAAGTVDFNNTRNTGHRMGLERRCPISEMVTSAPFAEPGLTGIVSAAEHNVMQRTAKEVPTSD